MYSFLDCKILFPIINVTKNLAFILKQEYVWEAETQALGYQQSSLTQLRWDGGVATGIVIDFQRFSFQ